MTEKMFSDAYGISNGAYGNIDYFHRRLLSFQGSFTQKKNQEAHRVRSARDFLKITENFDQHFDLVQHDAFACVTIYLQRS